MNLLIAIDDTDDVGTLGTGEILENMCHELAKQYPVTFSGITRHQLLIHQDIKYTSHNSSMCCIIKTDLNHIFAITEFAQEYLKTQSAPGSDPGLCLAVQEKLCEQDISSLISWGKLAKNEILTKDQAYTFAQDLGIHLSEHGGTGDGVIGALAGIGLRLSGNDGRFKGKLNLPEGKESLTVEELLAIPTIDKVLTEDNQELAPQEIVLLTDKIKTVFIDHHSVLPVRKNADGSYVNLSRKELKRY